MNGEEVSNMNDDTTLVIAAYDMPETNTLENQRGEFEKLTGTCVAVVRLSAEEMEKNVRLIFFQGG